MRKLGAVLALLLALWSSADARLHGGVPGPVVVTTWFGASVPTAPQTVPVRTFSLPSCGSTNNGSCYTPSNNAQAQADINAAASASGSGGDVIELTAGTNYGTLVLAAHGTTHGTIYIVSTQIPELGGSLPASGTRVGPGNVSNMPIISGSGNYLISDNGATTAASNYRLIGLAVEGTFTSGQSDSVVGMVSVGQSVTSSANLPSNVIIDRVYVLGDATNGAHRGITLAGNNVAVVDSYVANIFDVGNADNQAFANWNGGTGYLLDNNYFSAAGESFIFGGADPAATGIACASDITISNSTIFKGTSAGSPSAGKNAGELKCAVRVAIFGNHIEAAWGTQSEAIAITPRNQCGNNTQDQIVDVDIYKNRIWNILQAGMGAINISGQDTPSSNIGGCNPGTYSQATHRVRVRGNIFLGTDSTGGGAALIIITLPSDANATPTDIIIDHNTFAETTVSPYPDTYWIEVATPQNTATYYFHNLVVSNNAIDAANGYGPRGTDGTDVTAGMTLLISKYLASSTAVANAAIIPTNDTSSHFPTGNYDVTNEAAFHFNATGLSAEYPSTAGYVLLNTSPYYQQGVTGANQPYTYAGASDGTDIGANISQVAQ